MLRDYQQTVFDNIADSVRKGSKGVLAVLPCRSGKSYIMAEICRTAKGNVLILAHRHQLLNQHRELFKSMGITNARLVSVFTEANHLGQYPTPSIILIDEAHLSGAKSYRKVCEYYNTLVIGFTATPCRLDGKPLDLFSDLVIGISADELIAKGNISPYDYYAPDIGVNPDSIGVTCGDYNSKELAELMLTPHIYGNIINYYRELADGKQALAYCVNIAHAQHTAQLFIKNGIKADHVDSTMEQKIRDMKINSFRKGDVQVLACVNLISEGITLPECDTVLMLRPTHSVALFIQQACRCLTPMNGKRATIIDYVNNVQRHNLPTVSREWSLDTEVKHRKQLDDDGNLTIRQCSVCYKCFKTAPKCPYCGTEYKKTPRELKAVEEIKLRLIKAEELERQEQERKSKRMEVGQCRTLADLQRIAHERGYSQGWVWQMARLKKIYR